MAAEGSYHYNLEKADLKKASKELNENPKETNSQIDTFREWVLSQPHIRCRTDDHFLLRFLRAAKFSQLKAQEKLDNFLTVRCSHISGVPDWFADMDPTSEKMSQLLDMGLLFPLPGTDDERRTVILLRPGAFDPSEIQYGDIMKVGFMSIDALLRDESVQINGFVVLLDFGEFSSKHVTMLSRDFLSKCFKCWQDVYPTRNKASHYYDTPGLFTAFFEVVKYFLSEKNKKRVHFHKKSKDSIYRHIPKKMLPTEYGGKAGSVQELAKQWKQELIGSIDEFKLNEESLALDETKRPSQEDPDLGSWGLFGSFRKLAV